MAPWTDPTAARPRRASARTSCAAASGPTSRTARTPCIRCRGPPLPCRSAARLPCRPQRCGPAGRLLCTTRLNASAMSPRPRFHWPVRVLLEGQWRHQLDLVARPDAPLVDQVVADGPVTARGHGRHPHHFVLGERLLGEERPRQVQVAARPARVRAERPHMADRQRDLVRRERIAERRHVPVEAADRSAFVDDAEPVHVGFGGGERAVGEIRQRRVESDDRPGRAGAVGTMAGDAGRPVEILRGALRSARALCAERRAIAQDGESQQEQPSRMRQAGCSRGRVSISRR